MEERRRIIVGNTYGYITILATTGGKHPKYTWKCERCGEEYVTDGQTIFQYENSGCSKCRRNDRNKEAEYRKYIGNTYGQLKVVDYVGTKEQKAGKRRAFLPFMKCKCLKCGNFVEIPLTRLKQGGAKQCKKCNVISSLPIGIEYTKAASIDGTQVYCIDGRKKINKNSTTKYNGVSYMKGSHKYRAYINFKRKQYHLGSYEKIEDAVSARKEAEKKIYGEFLEWYANEYPEQWEKIKKKE